MAEYIDKDKFCHYLFKHIATFAENMIQMPVASTLQSVVNEIQEFQSEDVQPVVRCKDCVYKPRYEPPDSKDVWDLTFPFEWESPCPCYCEDGYYSHMPNDEWFCAYGKRQDGEE